MHAAEATCEDYHPNFRIIACICHAAHDLLDCLRPERIPLLWPVDSDLRKPSRSDKHSPLQTWQKELL